MDEAHVEHAVGLIEHQAAASLRRSTARCSARSSSRPGVAISRCRSRRAGPRSAACRSRRRRSDDGAQLGEIACRSQRALSATCAASSRVGVSTSSARRTRSAAARRGSGGSAARRRPSCRFRSGRPARTSRPVSTAGMAWRWMGDWGVVALFGHGTQQLGLKPEICKQHKENLCFFELARLRFLRQRRSVRREA